MLISWTVQTICPLLERDSDLVLATVISKSGSAPCLAGSKMIVHQDGSSLGSIGGGVLEAEAQKRAGEVFRTRISQHFIFDLSGRDAASMSMICGGRVEVLVEYIAADPANLQVFRNLNSALRQGEKCFLVSDLGGVDQAIGRIGRCLVGPKGLTAGAFSSGEAALATLVERAQHSVYPILTTLDKRRFLVERCFTPSRVHLFGAGHISRAVADLVRKVDFELVVLDDRAEFANRERFPTAEELRVIDSFDDCLSGIELDADSYAVVVTRGHTHDLTVLKQVLRTGAGYIGMLGSRKKILDIRQALLEEGFKEDDLARIHCPIGIKIGAETNAEIGVSIVAELIKDRAGKRS
jgi:xanthine dehydrogenase accessory factor